MATPTHATGRYHVNNTKPANLIASGLFLFAKLDRGFGIYSLAVRLQHFPASSKADRRQTSPTGFIIIMATSLTLI